MHDHDRGLDFDLPRLINRRRALGVMLGGLGSAVVVACGGSATRPTASSAARPQRQLDPRGDRRPVPRRRLQRPQHPRPRAASSASDITKSFGDASGVAEGVPTTIKLKLLDVAGGGKPLAGAAVYVWHCDREGRYSLYDEAIAGRELPARRPGVRRRRHADVQDDLPRRLPGPLAAHALRGLREPRRRDRRPGQAPDVAARHPAGDV